MFAILKGSLFQGAVALTLHGPFMTTKAAEDWAVEWLDGELEWFVMEVRDPNEFANAIESDEAPGELVEMPAEELERIIQETESRRRKPLKKEVMIDLSEIKD